MQIKASVQKKADKAQAQDENTSKCNSLVNRHQKAIERREKLKAACAHKVKREQELRGFMDALTTSPLVLDAWDEQLWQLHVVKGMVGRDGSIEFELWCGEHIDCHRVRLVSDSNEDKLA